MEVSLLVLNKKNPTYLCFQQISVTLTFDYRSQWNMFDPNCELALMAYGQKQKNLPPSFIWQIRVTEDIGELPFVISPSGLTGPPIISHYGSWNTK